VGLGMKTQTAKRATRTQLVEALNGLRQAVEADYCCQKIDPRNHIEAHTWIAIAMTETNKLLGNEAWT
jgi:hypothetical protein